MKKAELAELRTRARALQANVDGLVRLVFAIKEAPPPPPPQEPKEPVKYLTPQQVQELLGIGESTFYIWLKEGRLPKGQQWGPRSRRWRSDELEAYQNSVLDK